MPKCPVCDAWMKKGKTKETMPIRGGIASFDVTCWKCSKCGEEVYDERQYSQAVAHIQNVIKPMSKSLLKKAQKIRAEFELHFMKAKEKDLLLSTSAA